jgi:hypothetical protein
MQISLNKERTTIFKGQITIAITDLEIKLTRHVIIYTTGTKNQITKGKHQQLLVNLILIKLDIHWN